MVFFNTFLLGDRLNFIKIYKGILENHLKFFKISETLVFKTRHFSSNLEAVFVVNWLLVDQIQQLFPMPILLITRKNENLTYPLALSDGGNFENILWKNPHKDKPFFMPFIHNIVFPFRSLFFDKTDPVNIEQKQYLKPLLIGDKLHIVPLVLVNFVFVFTSLVFVYFLPLWDLEFRLLLFTLGEIILFVKVVSPPIVVREILTSVLSEDRLHVFSVFLWQFLWLDFFSVFELHPVVQGRT